MTNEYEVGEWDGGESLAAVNVDRIYDELYIRFTENTSVDTRNFLIDRVWNDWGSDKKLLTITDEQIQEYVDKLVDNEVL